MEAGWRSYDSMKSESEYHEGPEALKRFEDGMKKLFQAPKPAKSPFKTPAKQPKTSKG